MLNDVAPCAFCECAPLVAHFTLVVSATFPICGCGGGEAVTCNYMCVCVVLFYLTVMSDFDVFVSPVEAVPQDCRRCWLAPRVPCVE